MPTLQIDKLLFADQAVVAVTDDGRFVGCVGAYCGRTDPMVRNYFPSYHLDPEARVVYTLCVSPDFQGQGVGRRLVDAVSQPGVPTVLLIHRGGSASPQYQEIFDERVTRLLTTYDKLGFRRAGECSDYYLMERPCR